MAWNDAPPTEEELKKATPSWDSAPPTEDELKALTTDPEEKFGATIDEDIDRISKKYGVSKDYLRSRQIGMGYYPEEQAQQALREGNYGQHFVDAASSSVSSVLGEGLLGGLPSWVTKKLASDKEEDAIDELRKAVDHHKSGLDTTAEVILSATPSALASKAIGTGSKAAKVAQAALNIGEGARAGVMESDRGEEMDGALTGGLITAGTMGAMEAVPKVWGGAKKAGKWVGRIATGVPESAVDRYMANPARVSAAEGLEQITDNFVDEVDRVRQGLSGASSDAYHLLRNDIHVVPFTDFTDSLQRQIDRIEEVGAVGPERKKIIQYLRGLMDDMENLAAADDHGSVTLDKGKTLISVLDGKIDEMTKKGGDAQVLKALKNARGDVDELLKSLSPDYAEHMAKLASDTEAARGIASQFRSDKGAYNTLKQIMQSRDPYKRKALENFDKQFGTNFAETLKDSYAKDAFTKESTQGSRKTVGGGIVGSTIGTLLAGPLGGGVGGAVGAMAGMTADKYGGIIYKAILDGSLKVGRYTAPLKRIFEASGPAGVAAAHAALMGRDPEYRALVEESAKEDNNASGK